MTALHDASLRLWLLHRLPETDAAELEERLLRDDDVLERLREAETDLLDDYARGALNALDAAAFQNHRLEDAVRSGRWRAAIALARLRDGASVAPIRPSRSRWFAWAALAAGLAALAIGWQRWPAPATSTPLTFTLLASADRGAAAAVLRIPADAATLRLQLEAEESARIYRVWIETAGQVEAVGGAVEARQSGGYIYVEALLPARLLAPGSHRVLLTPQADGAPPEHVWDVDVENR